MAMTETTPWVVERLGVLSLARIAWLWRRERGSSSAGELLCLDGISPAARWAARVLKACGLRLTARELDFDFVDDVRLADGTRAIEQIYFKAAPVLVGAVEADPGYGGVIRRSVREASHEPYVRAFLAKQILSEAHLNLRSIMVASWYARTRSGGGGSVLYVKPGWLFEALRGYAKGWNVELRALGSWAWVLSAMGRRIRLTGKGIYLWWNSLRPARLPQVQGGVRIAAEMYLKGIRRDPLYHTDFFWYREPVLPPGAVFGYFARHQDQPTPARRACLEAAGIGWVDRSSLRRLMYSPVRSGPPRTRRPDGPDGLPRRRLSPLQAAAQARVEDFYAQYDGWLRFFLATQTRVHVSTSDVFPASEAVHAAVADAGGVSVSIQRSIERDPYVLRRTVADVHFAFSKAQAQRERLSGSRVRQFIAAGYPFDDVFETARANARELAGRLKSRGVKFILCFLDENDGLHPKRVGGRKLIRGDYGFLCDRLAADPTLGLVLKPKRAETLPARLGPVWRRLQGLVESGRCLILEGRPLDERYLPCVGSSAADLSINLLYGGTPGLESYLAGTPTLLIGHGVERGIFDRLPPGSVVFESWSELWEAVERFRAHRDDPRIGNWEPIVDEFAFPRDGRAARRIHQYLVWLYGAFASGKNREEALSEARRRYEEQWGQGWITEIGPDSPIECLSPVVEEAVL